MLQASTAEHPVPGRRSLSSSSSVSRKSANRRAASHTCPPVVPIVEPVPLFARSTCDCPETMSVSHQESPQGQLAVQRVATACRHSIPTGTSISTSRSHGISEGSDMPGGGRWTGCRLDFSLVKKEWEISSRRTGTCIFHKRWQTDCARLTRPFTSGYVTRNG